jgi:phosphotransferase system, enzyme I, PtsP
MATSAKDPRSAAKEPALRIITRRLREIMAAETDGQNKLDKIVRAISGIMVAEVCSIYLKRQDGTLELFATEGLNPSAIHNTFMRRGEGLVGRCAEVAQPVNEADAQSHPSFSYRPETGEEPFHSLLAVPVTRRGDVLGVLVVQNKNRKEYSDEDVEVLETTAMVLAEHLVSGDVAGVNSATEFSRAVGHVVKGQPIADGLALGHVVFHESRVVVTDLRSADTAGEIKRLEAAVDELRASLDELLEQGELAVSGEHRDVFDAYRMFAHDRGWLKRMKEAIAKQGLTAEAAVERVQNDQRARLLSQPDSYLRERMKDLDELSERLLRVLTGRVGARGQASSLPPDTILVARTMGPADLLDYDRTRLKGLVIEDSSGSSHVAIVAKALGIAAIGQARGVMERADAGNPIIVDAMTGDVFIRPSSDVIAAYADKARFQARRQRKYRAMKDVAPVTRDGQRIDLNINAGLLVDMPQLQASGADGIGLFRTELQFMISNALPRLERQTQMYRAILDEAGSRPVTFRTLDIGGDKVLPYLRHPQEENPALGWRAIRMSLDRPGLLRTQVRALLRAAVDKDLRMMLPMVASVAEVDAARGMIDREIEFNRRRGSGEPASVAVGVMIEVPSLLFDLDRIFDRVDFASVGSNDLLQYLFAADRNNERTGARYDALSYPALRALGGIVAAARRAGKPVTLCGEMAGRPLDALALVALGFRSLSMAPSALGPLKAMLVSLDASRASKLLETLLQSGAVGSAREELQRFVKDEGVDL